MASEGFSGMVVYIWQGPPTGHDYFKVIILITQVLTPNPRTSL